MRRLLGSILSIAPIAIFLCCAAAAQPAWRNVEISGSGCWVTGIVAQPKVRNLFYIRTDVGGCYRWNPVGQEWVPITDFIPVQQRYDYGCTSIAVDPNNANTVYIACGAWLANQFGARPGVIYKSTNRGETWKQLGLKAVYMGANDDLRWGGERLAIQPGNSRVMLFGSRNQGLWRSANSGVDWQQTALPYPKAHNDIGVQAVAFDPKTPSTVYAAVSGNGIFRSTDSGRSWASISSSITTPARLIVDTDHTAWVTYGNGVSKFSQGRWTNCTPSGETANPYCGLAVNPIDHKNVLVSYGLWGSPQPNAIMETWDAGASWKTLAANITANVPWYKASNPNGVAPFDISNFLFDPNNPKSVWFVSGGGIWNTPDITRGISPTFYQEEKGHEELCVSALAAPPSGPELVTGVMDVDGFVFDKGIQHYPSHAFVDIGSWASDTVAIAYEEDHPLNMVRLCVQGTPWNKPCIVASSQDGGLTWKQDPSFPTKSPSDGSVMVPGAVAVSATDPANIVVNVTDTESGKQVWFYKTASTSWKECSGLPAASGVSVDAQPVAADHESGGTFYAYVSGAIYRSTDGGATFQKISSEPIGAANGASFFKLVTQPRAAGDLWLSEENDNPNYLSDTRPSWEGLYHSSDSGHTWAKLPRVTRAMTFSFGAPSATGIDTLYYYGRLDDASMDRIYRSTDLGKSWTNIQNPGQAIGDCPWVMAGSRQTYGRVFIGTSGRGIYYSSASAAAPKTQTAALVAPGTGLWRQFSVHGMAVDVLLPQGYTAARKYPVILYLHQLDMGDWPQGLLAEINPWFNSPQWRKRYPAIVIAPLLDQTKDKSGQTINFGGVSPADQPGEDNAIAALEHVLNQYSCDRSRLYVTGNSLGGIGTWDMLINYNAISGTQGRIFAAGMPLAGATYDHGYPVPDPTVVAALRTVPIWAIHGAQDTTVPLVWDKSMAAALASSPTFHFTLDPSLGHDVWDTYYSLPEGKANWDWLFAQKASQAVSAPKLLPFGYLSTRGRQIVDRHGVPVRIASVGGFGTDIVGGRISYPGPYLGADATIAAVKATGFNCIRVDFNDKSVSNPLLMSQFDQLVAACKKYGVKVIFDHHNDEATAADWGNAAQQTNGLWYDSGPGSDGTDGAGDKGTVTKAVFQKDWVTMAKHWKGNSTVIGFDLDNEPHIGYGTPFNGENWGGGGPGDIRAMYENVGNAIEAVDPGALIICEGLMDNTDKTSNIWWTMDLTHVVAKPVVLQVPHKVVYSVHEYPNMRNGGGGPTYLARLNEDWGYLVKQNIAPVWIGEMGASMETPSDTGWGTTLLNYMNGFAPDGPRFSAGEQPISGDWWRWGYIPENNSDGCLDEAGQVRPREAPYINAMQVQHPPKLAGRVVPAQSSTNKS